MTTATADKVLLAAPGKPASPMAQTIADVARGQGISPFRQLREMMRLRFGAHKLGLHEYYSNQVYREGLSAADKKTYVGERGSFLLNNRLSPKALTDMRPFVRDKVLYTAALRQFGIATTQTQAVASASRQFGNLPGPSSAAEVEEFLLTKATYPLFVKPEEGSGSVGSALITYCDTRRKMLKLANGKDIEVAAFAREAMEDYGHGLVFQSAVTQHDDVRALIGDAVGTVRVVTVIEDQTPKVLYALWKIPSPTAMSDNYWQDGSMIAAIDAETGVVQQCHRGSGPGCEVIENHPVSGKAIRGFQMPNWDKTLQAAMDGHKLLPEFGVFGWDVAVGPDGPVIIECNANPHHMLYQLANHDGILNETFAPIFDRIEARAKRLQKERDARKVKDFKARKLGK